MLEERQAWRPEGQLTLSRGSGCFGEDQSLNPTRKWCRSQERRSKPLKVWEARPLSASHWNWDPRSWSSELPLCPWILVQNRKQCHQQVDKLPKGAPSLDQPIRKKRLFFQDDWLCLPLVRGHLPSWPSSVGSGEVGGQSQASSNKQGKTHRQFFWPHKEFELHSVSKDLLKNFNLGMTLQQNFIQQTLLELLLTWEAHIDRVPALVEATV